MIYLKIENLWLLTWPVRLETWKHNCRINSRENAWNRPQINENAFYAQNLSPMMDYGDKIPCTSLLTAKFDSSVACPSQVLTTELHCLHLILPTMLCIEASLSRIGTFRLKTAMLTCRLLSNVRFLSLKSNFQDFCLLRPELLMTEILHAW